MAREYGKVSSRFWTGETGRELKRLGHRVQLMALYLLTCPSSNMIGLYYLPFPMLRHETGMTFKGASEALQSLCEAQFLQWDEAAELVFVPEMAAYQIGEPLNKKDNRVKAIIKEWRTYRKSHLYYEFHRRYRESFHLPDETYPEAPSKPLRSQEQEQEQEKENSARFRAPCVEDVRDYCRARQNDVDAEQFVDFYTANGWVQARGKPIRDWRAAVRTWEKRGNPPRQRVMTDEEMSQWRP